MRNLRFGQALKDNGVFMAILAMMAAFHILVSVSGMPNKFDNEPGAGAFGGIRLHYLDIWNFDFSKGVSSDGGTSHILDNFIKSAVSGTHGMLDFLHWYIYIGIYDFLGIPINEFWLLTGQTLVMIISLLIMCLLLERIYGNRLTAIIFILISSSFYISYSRSFYIIPPNTLMEAFLLYALYYYNCAKDRLPVRIALIILIFLNTASGNVIKLPVFLLFIWCVNYKANGLSVIKAFREYVIKKPSNLIFAVPASIAILGHFYVYSRIGASNLGILGWISQKIGLGAPAFSKLVLVRQALEKYVFSGVIDWWAVIIISAFYGLAVLRGGRNSPLLLFPLLYYFYLINLEPNSAALAYIILISIGISEMFSILKAMNNGRLKRPLYVFASIAALCVLFIPVFGRVHYAVKKEIPAPNYLKSIGFFLRENMAGEDKIASLLSETDNILNEYYYGKTFFKSPVFGKEIYDYRNLTRPQSSDNPVSPDEVNTEFPFYVVSEKFYKNDEMYSSFVDALIKRYLLKKVADVTRGGAVYASVYSSRPIRYTKLDTEDANVKFDKKYANLRNLFYNRHVGVASTWGYY
jgi:hypothetical protein